jgi:hypothetical protein
MPQSLEAAEKERLPKRRDLAVAAIMERIGGGGRNPAADELASINRALFM